MSYRFKCLLRRFEVSLFLLAALFVFAWFAKVIGAPLSDYDMTAQAMGKSK